MSIYEPRCLVCGASLDKGAPFNRNLRISECCSDECYKEYMTDDEGICHIEKDKELANDEPRKISSIPTGG